MNQPPPDWRPQPAWRRPRGVAVGTWDYVQQRSIADHYDAFVADTPLCRMDQKLLQQWLPGLKQASPELVTGELVTGELVTGELVMDLGAGTGRAAMSLASRGYQVVAIDLSQPMLKQLSGHLEDGHLEDGHLEDGHLEESIQTRVHPVRANLVELECFGDDTADHAICLFSTLGMIQGRSNRVTMLRHVSRIVRPGGTLIVHVHNRWSALREPLGALSLLRSRLRSWFSKSCEFGDSEYAYRGLDRMFLHRFSRSELVRDLQLTGWEPQQIERIAIDGALTQRSRAIPGGYIARCFNAKP